MTMTLDGTNGVTFFDTSLQGAAASPYVLKNRIINGAMVIDQRNAGAASTPTGGYTLDRWSLSVSQNSKFTAQQNAAAVTPPTGFTNYLGLTTAAAVTVGASDYFGLYQPIEGYNIADLDFGKATAKTVTLSFWVRSSLTGTFGGALQNGAFARSYPFTYTISVANTWEQKSVTIAGDTSGTWVSTTAAGLNVWFSLGTGSTYNGTANAWAGTTLFSVTGATSVVGTLGATFYITGVQLEQNTSATPFERRLYNQELANCQRYYHKILPGASVTLTPTGYNANTTLFAGFIQFPVTMRTVPTALEQSGTATDYQTVGSYGSIACSAVPTFNDASINLARTHFTVASGLTAGQGGISRAATANGYLAWSVEL